MSCNIPNSMKKIAIITNTLFNSAGMERVLTDRANALCDEYDITLITRNQGNRPDFFPLNNSVHRIDLKVDNKSDYENKLSDLLCSNHYDITTSTGGDEMWFLWKIKDGSRKILEFHFSFDVSRMWMADVRNPIKRWLGIRLQTLHRIKHARHYDLVVALCKTDARKWKRWCRHVEFTYNPTSIHPTESSLCSFKTVVAVGRLDMQKGFDYLIDAWRQVNKKHSDWQLNIWGEGDSHKELQNQIDACGLTNKIRLCGRTDDIESKYLNSSVYVCSSRGEAFGLTIAEAEACGLPVVTFACPNAPAELVEDSVTGYVVHRVGDTDGLADRICKLIEDGAEKRRTMGAAGQKFAQQFSMKNIMHKWRKIYG